jgi:hypothetical protein
MDKQSLVEANYMNKILDILSSNEDKKTMFTNIRQLLADSQVKDFSNLYRFLYDNLESYATGHVAAVILIIADAQYKDSFIVDKEIGVMSMFIQLLNEIK